LAGLTGEASSKAKGGKGKAEKKGGKDDKSSEKGKAAKEVILQWHTALCRSLSYLSTY